ncbi:Transcription repressor OFP17 [Ananas comosus]|uniref:Transcription repressor OFP17 n=1 Tax=Ananas comosus TaxID=4615 RepID=A0A199UPT0_ANACO|nr:Transcription repressor OFP17 [Ananas comosus]
MSPNRSRRCRFRSVGAVFWRLVSMRSAEAIDRVGELPSLTDRVQAPLSSPVTPAYAKIAQLRREESVERRDDEAEEACRSFESYLREMLVEEGRVRDLMDVEELLYCWESLKCPAFVELVCRFYGELCKDLFSNNEGGVVVDQEPVST